MQEDNYEEHSLYGGEVLLRYYPKAHRYYAIIKGRKYSVPSVTTALGVLDKPALIPWAVGQAIDLVRLSVAPGVEHAESYLEEVYAQAKKEAGRKRSEAAARGTIVHSILSNDGTESVQLLGVDDGVLRKVRQAQTWLKENDVRITTVERPVYSRRYRFSGRLDYNALVKGVPSLLDWKTSKGVYPEYRLQLAAYNHAFEEEFPQEVIQQRIILHLEEDKVTPHIYTRDSLRQDFNAFLAALRIHTRLKQIQQEEKLSRKRQKDGQIE